MKHHNNTFVEYIGWCGALAVVVSYGLYASGVFTADNLWFHLLNLFGAVGIIAVSLHKKAWQPAVVYLMWGAVAAYSLYVYLQ